MVTYEEHKNHNKRNQITKDTENAPFSLVGNFIFILGVFIYFIDFPKQIQISLMS